MTPPSESSTQNLSKEQEHAGSSIFLEQLRNQPDMLRIMELLSDNGLVKPVYVVERFAKKPEPKGDDTLSRLEAIVEPPKIKEHRNLLGVFLPLGLGEEDDWLFVSSDGTIIRLKPPKPKTSFYYMFS